MVYTVRVEAEHLIGGNPIFTPAAPDETVRGKGAAADAARDAASRVAMPDGVRWRILVWQGRQTDVPPAAVYTDADWLLERIAAHRDAMRVRDELIRDAMRPGMQIPRAALADAAGVKPARLYQIRDAENI